MAAHRWLLAAVALLAGGLVGCGSSVARLGPGGAWPGLVSETTYPNALLPGERREAKVLTAKDIEILGPGRGEAESTNVSLGLVSRAAVALFVSYSASQSALTASGDSGFGHLLDSMRSASKADGFLNLAVDTHFKSLDLLIIRFDRVRTEATGIGYRVRGGAGAAAVPRERGIGPGEKSALVRGPIGY